MHSLPNRGVSVSALGSCPSHQISATPLPVNLKWILWTYGITGLVDFVHNNSLYKFEIWVKFKSISTSMTSLQCTAMLSTVLATSLSVRLCVRPSVRPSHACRPIVSKRMNVGWWRLRWRVTHWFYYSQGIAHKWDMDMYQRRVFDQ